MTFEFLIRNAVESPILANVSFPFITRPRIQVDPPDKSCFSANERNSESVSWRTKELYKGYLPLSTVFEESYLSSE